MSISREAMGNKYARVRFLIKFRDCVGQTIAIVDAYEAPPCKMISTAFATLSPAEERLAIYYRRGNRQDRSNWALETSLDVEWLTHRAGARIVVVIGNRHAKRSAQCGPLRGRPRRVRFP